MGGDVVRTSGGRSEKLCVFYAVFVCNSLVLVGLALPLGDQVTQAAVDIGSPRVGADAVAFVLGSEAYMREADFCFIAFLGDVKDNVGICPLALVLYEVEVVVCNVPGHLSTWSKSSDADRAAMYILVVVIKFSKFVSPTFNFL